MHGKELELANHWRDRVAAYYQKPVQPLTAEQVWRIKSLLKATGGISRTLINFAIENWKAFTATVMEETTSPGCPDAPHPGYLLKHRYIALEMMVQAGIIESEDVKTDLEAAKYFDFK
jgi:hypothetical protein